MDMSITIEDKIVFGKVKDGKIESNDERLKNYVMNEKVVTFPLDFFYKLMINVHMNDEYPEIYKEIWEQISSLIEDNYPIDENYNEFISQNMRFDGRDDNDNCKRCGKLPTKDEHDICISDLPGVVEACCGHGVNKGYALFENGVAIIGYFDVKDKIK